MTKTRLLKIKKITIGIMLLLSPIVLAGSAIGQVYAANTCGGPGNQVTTSIDLGCRNEGNPITDLLFAIIRLLSAGVGIVVIGSIVVAGIQYSASRDDPQATAKARGRIATSLGALLIYIFAYAILNYVIPGQFFK